MQTPTYSTIPQHQRPPDRQERQTDTHHMPTYTITIHRQAAAAKSDEAQDSPMLRLPPELRNRIYSYAFDCIPKAIKVYTKNSRIHFCKPPPLLHVCRQIRSEARPIYYPEHAFFMDISKPTTAWLESLGDNQRALLGQVYISTTARVRDSEHAQKVWSEVSEKLVKRNVTISKTALWVQVRMQGYKYRGGSRLGHWLYLPNGQEEVVLVKEYVDAEARCEHSCNHGRLRRKR